ncbi:putative LRR receptor-like serine/threonine-protein kinase [Gossypium australe]|uniref:Putative LRR receptor-like serine/threonine-protein kinase n=1 Tax=Gossypium australe TaxID=47621 RepID=A0A5B6U6V3_9ROSI|nr:putative LRR receptor-like serine/threonine-protein kinase [Gossypium australe]
MSFLHYFLSIEVTHLKNGGLHLCQQKYVLDFLEGCHMDNAKGVPTPLISSCPLSKHMGTLLVNPRECRSIAGALQYIVLTRPDIAYVVNYWGLDFDDLRSTIGYCVYLGGNPKHQVVSRSTAEAKYRGIGATVIDITWLKSLLTELHLASVDKTTIWCDNSNVVAVATNPALHSKFKQVELDLFFV